jgi:hypothetical protein
MLAAKLCANPNPHMRNRDCVDRNPKHLQPLHVCRWVLTI